MGNHQLKNSYRSPVSLAVAAAIAAASGIAYAQEETKLEEVTVTATRRAESLQDISIAVTAIGEKELALGGIQDVSRLEHLVPGLRFGQSGHEARIAIRGTRTNNVGTEAEQVVGIFEDGVYVPTTTQALGAYVDVKRIEVLRGPQGTLYGRNTFGGTINVITNEPDFSHAHGTATGIYGDYERFRIDGYLNIPVGEKFALRVAGMREVHDGYIENFNQPGTSDDLSDEDIKFVRLSAKWQVSDDFGLLLRHTFNDRDTNGNAIWGYQQIGGYVGGQYRVGHQYAPSDASNDFDRGPWEVSRNQKSNAMTESSATTLTADWNLGAVALKVIGNHTKFDGQQNFDSDYTDGGDPLNNGFTGWDSGQDTSSVELQLTSTGDGPFKWLLGAYHFELTANWNWQEFVNGVPSTPHWDNQGDFKSDSTAVFANASYALTDRTRVIGGLRWQEDTKSEKDQLDWSVFPPVQDFGSAREGTWDEVLWKVGLERDLREGMLAYGTVSTGYRAGGFNVITTGVPSTYDPETVTAYEIGLKSTLADGRVVLNLAAYHNQYRDMQAQSFVVLGGGVTEFTENGGEIDATGLEAELSWRPGPNWDLGASLALANAEFGTYNVGRLRGLGTAGGRQDLTNPARPALSLEGWEPALSPDLTFGLQAGYTFRLGNGGTFKPYLQTSYTSKYAASDINLPGVFQDAHTKSDLRLIWTHANEKLQIQGFVLNLENEAVLNRVVIFNPDSSSDLASLQANWNNPRTWGVSLTYDFD